jgi:hypothetical protein
MVSVLALMLASDGLLASPPQGPPGGGGGGPKKGKIVGEVVGSSGSIAGATVMLFDGVAMDQIAETVTDSGGSFQFNKIPAGTYTVTAISFNPPSTGNTTVTVVPRQTVVVVVACQ